MESQPTSLAEQTDGPGNSPSPKRSWRIGSIIGAGLFAGLVAASIGGVAAAQTVQLDDIMREPVAAQAVAGAQDEDQQDESQVEQPDEPEPLPDSDPDSDDGGDRRNAVDGLFERFDECLTDAGIDFESSGSPDSHRGFHVRIEGDDAALEAAIDQCEAILGELGDELFTFAEEIFPDHDGAFVFGGEMFEAFHDCIDDALNSEAAEGSDEDARGEPRDSTIEACESLIDEFEGFGDLGDSGEFAHPFSFNFDLDHECPDSEDE